MSSEQKNLFLAIGLSLFVLLGWNYFYGAPKMDAARQAAQQSTQAAPPNAVTPASPAANPENPGLAAAPGAPADVAQIVRTREQALALSPRVAIDTPSLTGSISLKGGRIDDVSLKNYRETIDPKSP